MHWQEGSGLLSLHILAGGPEPPLFPVLSLVFSGCANWCFCCCSSQKLMLLHCTDLHRKLLLSQITVESQINSWNFGCGSRKQDYAVSVATHLTQGSILTGKTSY